MQIEFYTGFSKRKNSTKQPVESATVHKYTYDVKMKEGTSLEEPTMYIVNPKDRHLNFTYAKWDGRYYFVTDVTLGNNLIYEISMKQDVLASHKAEIGNLSTFIDRAVTLWNPDIPDNMFIMKPDIIQSRESAVLVPGSSYDPYSGGTYCLVAQGYDDICYLITPGQFRNLLTSIRAQSTWKTIVTAINNIIWVPFSLGYITTITETLPLMLGSYTGPQEYRYYVTEKTNVKDVTAQFAIPNIYNDWRDKDSNWSNVSVRLFNEQIPISPLYLNKTISLNYAIDPFTGTAYFELTTQAYIDELLEIDRFAYFSKNIGVPLRLSQDQPLGNILWSSLTGLISSGAGFASRDAGAGLNNALAVSNNLMDYYTSGMANGMSTGTIGGNRAEFDGNQFYVKVQRYGSAEFPTSNVGRLVQKYEKISNHTGFIKCLDASIQIDGFDNDRDEINQYLNGGFYYE